jgi:quercetin dioxygenase-like cupin family protein
MTASLQIKPYVLECDEGQKLELLGALGFVKANTEQTGAMFNLFEVTGPAGLATPLHIHYAEDVAVFVLEGSLAVYCGEEKNQATPGSFFFQPRGTPHGFRVTGDTPARVLYLTTPAGFDQFVLEGVAGREARDETAARHRSKSWARAVEDRWLRKLDISEQPSINDHQIWFR